MGKYFKNILIAVDQLAGTICGLDPDETISSYFGKRSGSNVIRKAIDAVFGKGHCERSIEPDEGKDAVLK